MRSLETLCGIGAIALVILGSVACAQLGATATALDAKLLAVDPEIAADVDCVVEALAAHPNILDPVSDLELAGAVYGCFVGGDAGPSISEDTAVALVAKHRATAATKARARTAKMGAMGHRSSDPGVTSSKPVDGGTD